jgi:ABC-type uncharacterized transport system auxiliary subunit
MGVGGCFGQRDVTPVRYYSVSSAPATVSQATRSWPVALGIRPLTAATRYRDQILYRVSEVEVGFYAYDRWVEPPEEMVTRILIEMLHAAGLFRQVTTADDVRPPAWILSGEVTRFDEIREAGGRRAEVGVRLELRQARDERLLWSDVLKGAVPYSTDTPEALAQAMSRAVQEVTLQLIARLQEADLP